MFWYGFFVGWFFCGLITVIDEFFHLDNIQIYGGLGWLLVLPIVPIVFPILFIKTMADPYYRTEFLKQLKKKFHKK